MKTVFTIEGPIGVGKSTLLNELEQKGFPVFYEPTEEWEPWLRHFYTSLRTPADSIFLQKRIGHSIARRSKKIWESEEPVIIMERSLSSGLEVFTAVNKKLTPDPRWEEVETLYRDLISLWETPSDVIRFHSIALHVPFGTVIDRAMARGGPDASTSVQYHKNIYDQSLSYSTRCPSIVYIDNSCTPSEVCEKVHDIIKKNI